MDGIAQSAGSAILTVSRPDGSLEAILVGYACHPTTLNFTSWCGDYPGFAQLDLERAHPGTSGLFVNSCGGDHVHTLRDPFPVQNSVRRVFCSTANATHSRRRNGCGVQ